MYTVGLDVSSFCILFFNSSLVAMFIQNTINNSNYEMTPEVRQIIFGSLLGDGKLEKSSRSKNARFGFTQSKDKLPY